MKPESYRKIILGIAVVIMAFSLRHTWMVVVQAIAGGLLTILGVISLIKRAK